MSLLGISGNQNGTWNAPCQTQKVEKMYKNVIFVKCEIAQKE